MDNATMTPEKAQALLDGVTPGPLSCQCFDAAAYVYGAGGTLIAEVMGAVNGSAPANARLFKAAPDLARAYIAQAAELTRLTKWRAEEGEKIKRQAKALTALKAHCERVEAERDGLARKVAEVQRSGDDLAHSELADLQARVHNQRQEIARLRAHESRAQAAELTRLRARIEAADRLAEAIKHYRNFVLDHTGSGEVVPVITEPAQRLTAALSAYGEAGK